MARAVSAALVLVACLLLPLCSAQVGCTIKAPAPVIKVNTSWTAPLLLTYAQPLIVDELNGPVKANTANLIIPPGAGFPPHSHPDREEYMYFTQGEGELTVWFPGMARKKTLKVKAGDLHFTPLGGIHEVKNTKTTGDLVAMTWVSPGPIRLRVYNAGWPASLAEAATAGFEVDAIALVLDQSGCPPGHKSAPVAGQEYGRKLG